MLLALQPLIEPLRQLAATLTEAQAQVVVQFLQEAADIHARFAADEDLPWPGPAAEDGAAPT